MTRVEQTILAPPRGNCFSACVASVLELPLDRVPNFVGDYGHLTDGEWMDSLLAWSMPMNLAMVLVDGGGPCPPGYSIACCSLPSGSRHAVVMLNGEVAWDPSPRRDDRPLLEVILWTIFTVLDPTLPINIGLAPSPNTPEHQGTS